MDTYGSGWFGMSMFVGYIGAYFIYGWPMIVAALYFFVGWGIILYAANKMGGG